MIHTPESERHSAINSIRRCIIDLDEEDKRRIVFRLFGMVSARHPEMLLEAAEATDLLDKIRAMDKLEQDVIQAKRRQAERCKGEKS